MNLLAIETSSDVGTVALESDDGLRQERIETPREQTAKILPLIDELIDSAELTLTRLDAIAFGRGPGSFTGIRVAAAVAQGLGLSANLPLLPISSLAAVAQGAWRTQGQEHSLVCFDARMGEVFWAPFQIRGGLPELIGEERLSEPDAVCWPDSQAWGAVGSGFDTYAARLAGQLEQATSVRGAVSPEAADLLPLARSQLKSGNSVPAPAAAPVYLRGQSAWSK
ncbi:MAG: tRNA (adenosine(37)-N6)-threonylcarbamoyltransferase complex dimerization subunit type 1 TsaB [Candidatus Rariloculaceae bacterium]